MAKLYEYIIKVKEQGMEKLKQFASAAGSAQVSGDKLSNTLNRAAGSGNVLSGSMNRLRGAKTTVIAKVREFGSAIVRAGARSDEFRRKLNQTRQSTGGLSNALGGLKNQIATVFAIGTLVAFGSGVVNTTARAEGLTNAISFASGSAKEAAANMSFLEQTANSLGIPLEASQRGFKLLAGSMMGTKLMGQATRDIFEGVAVGASAMGLSTEQSEGAFLALSQMMSKGKVQAEELRGQLAERIPGSFQIAARAIGVSTSKLDEMLKKGEVVSSVFLPKFAAEMKRTFEGALPKSTLSLQANLNRMHNQWYLMNQFLGEQFKPVINEIVIAFGKLWAKIREHKEVIQGFASAAYTGVRAVIDVLKWLGHFVKDNWTLIKGLGITVAWAAGIFYTYRAAVWATILVKRAYAAATITARLATVLFTGGFRRLNMVMRANVVGLVVTAIAALISLLVVAYNKLDWFRGGVHGLWEAFKEVGSILKDSFLKIIEGTIQGIGGIGMALWRLVHGDFKGAAKEGREALAGMMKVADGTMTITNPAYLYYKNGEQIGKKFKEGYNKGVKSGPIDPLAALGLGGSMPGVPADPTNNNTTDNSTKDGIESIAGGGSKSVNVTVNLGKFFENIIYNSTAAESAEDVERIAMETFARVLNGGVYAASQ